MATTTANYGLTKPSYNDDADIAVINNNMDIIDTKMKEMAATSGGSVVYSTDEQVIGTWINGKPIYRKCVEVLPSGSYFATNANILTFSKTASLGGFFNIIALNAYRASDGAIFYLPNKDALSANSDIDIIQNSASVYVKLGSDYSNYINKIVGVFEYTKSTD